MFQFSIKTVGNYSASFVFKDEESLLNWLVKKYPLLEMEHGKTNLFIKKLDSLNIGDKCYVAGEGEIEHEILDIKKNDENSYSFVLKDKIISVNKCFKSWFALEIEEGIVDKIKQTSVIKRVLFQKNYILIEN